MYLDHINGIRDDNRIENLRDCTQQQNTFNTKSRPNSTSKYKGVHWKKDIKKWSAQYTLNSKNYHIGCFDTELEAAQAYIQETSKFQKEYANQMVIMTEGQ